MTETEIKIIGLLWEFFKGDSAKVTAWLKTENPLLGSIKPIHMMVLGRTDKVDRSERLLKAMQDMRDGNIA